MVDVKSLFKPTKFNVILSLLLIIPCLTLLMLVFTFLLQEWYYLGYFFDSSFSTDLLVIAVGVCVVLSYLLGSILDHLIPNQKLKITIAVASGLVSLLILYLIYKAMTEPVICDPVHVPNQTICDPVHQPSQGSYPVNSWNELQVDSSAAKSSFQECLENLYSK